MKNLYFEDIENKNGFLKVRLLSVNALKVDDCWTWDIWDTIDIVYIKEDLSDSSILKALRDNGILTDYSKGKVYLHDDGYNIEIIEYDNNRPILALCYGEFFNL